MQKPAESIIAVFDDELRTIAFVSVAPKVEAETTSYISKPDKSRLLETISLLQTKSPRIRIENIENGVISMALQTVKNGSDDFLPAVEEELKIAGLTCKIVPAALKPLLVHMS